jgi:hypothetical protein
VAFDTKMMISAVSQLIAKSETLEEAYRAVQKMGNVEGVFIEPYEEVRAQNEKDKAARKT